MTKLKTFFRRLFAGSFKRMFGYIGTIHKETGKNRFIMFFDMIWLSLIHISEPTRPY